MFYSFIVFGLCNIAIAAVIPGDKDATILSYEYKNFGEGNYEFSYDTSNGIIRKETGRLVNAGQDNEHIVVNGTYSYVDPEGVYRLFQYIADENGYRIEFQQTLDIRVSQDFESVGVTAGVAPHIASLLGR